jgi:hypothetical protein
MFKEMAVHGGGVGEADDDAVGGGFDVFDGAILGQKMVRASGINYSGVYAVVQVVGLVATCSRGVRNLVLLSGFVFTNRFVSPPTPSGVG